MKLKEIIKRIGFVIDGLLIDYWYYPKWKYEEKNNERTNRRI